MTMKNILCMAVLAAFAVAAASGDVWAAKKKDALAATAGPAMVQLLAFMAPIKRTRSIPKDTKIAKEMPITISFEVPDGTQVSAICELAPRLRDAVMETLYYNPIPIRARGKLDFKKFKPKVLKAMKKAVRPYKVSAVEVEQGAIRLKTGSSRSRANALGCGRKAE